REGRQSAGGLHRCGGDLPDGCPRLFAGDAPRVERRARLLETASDEHDVGSAAAIEACDFRDEPMQLLKRGDLGLADFDQIALAAPFPPGLRQRGDQLVGHAVFLNAQRLCAQPAPADFSGASPAIEQELTGRYFWQDISSGTAAPSTLFPACIGGETDLGLPRR